MIGVILELLSKGMDFFIKRKTIQADVEKQMPKGR